MPKHLHILRSRRFGGPLIALCGRMVSLPGLAREADLRDATCQRCIIAHATAPAVPTA